jgi:hypothetical protein
MLLVAFMILAWPLAWAVALFFVFRPVRSWPVVATRWRAFGVFLAIFVAVPALMQLFVPFPVAEYASGRLAKEVAPRIAPPRPASPSVPARPNDGAAPTGDLDDLQLSNISCDTTNSIVTTRPGFFRPRVSLQSVLLLSGTIHNSGRGYFRDIHIYCALRGDSGTQLGKVKGIVYERLDPGQTVSFSNVQLGLGPAGWSKCECRVYWAGRG